MDICSSCRRAIGGSSVLALGGHYHPDCFRCSSCNKHLESSFLTGSHGQPLCTNCGLKTGGAGIGSAGGTMCYKCQKPIVDSILTAMGHRYHENCFTCAQCEDKLTGTFHPHNELPFCSKCYNIVKNSPNAKMSGSIRDGNICAKCLGPIIDGTIVTALNRSFHKACFKCSGCNKPITGDFNSPDDATVYCIQCYNQNFSKRCHVCQTPIADTEFTVFNSFNYHHSCFRCTICGRSLVGQPLGMTENRLPCCVSHTL